MTPEREGFQPSGPRAITRREEAGSFPASFAQQRLWFLDQLEPGNPVYNIWAAFRLRGALDVAALERSLDELVRRHEALRTTFADADGQPKQVIHAASRVPLPVIDLQQFSESEREEGAAKLATAEAGEPFDLSRGPLFRANLLRLAPEDHVLLLTMHHIVSDAWSKEILLRELAALYGAFSQDRPSLLPDLPIQYADYAVWQREWLQGKVLESQISYWKRQLGGDLPVLRLPADRPRPAVQTFRGGERQVLLSRDLTDALEGLGRREGVTLFMTLLAAFEVLLSRHTGQEDIPVGTTIAGRTRVETEGLIGFFVNTLVLRGDLSGDPTFRELLKRVREVALEAYEHQDLPFEKLVDELKPERSLSQTPLFQVLFTLQNAPMRVLDLQGLSSIPMTREHSAAMFDLTLLMARTEQGLLTRFQYNSDLFDAATMDRMLEHFEALLGAVVVDPGQRISRLSFLSEAERRRVLVEWNRTEKEYPRDETVHGLFEAQVERSPQSVAIELEGERLTYGQLNARSNQLASHLKGLGIGPEVLVGLCMERSVEMVVGLLGILKAGGAYVPLDPTYPKERLSFMLEDTQARVLLTQSRLVEKLPATTAQVLCIDRDGPAIEKHDSSNPKPAASSQNLAYVIYTSGSTGKPKGVAIEHRSTVTFLHWAREVFAVQDLAGVLASTSVCFDLSVFEIFGPLSWGGRAVLVKDALSLPSLTLSAHVRLVNTVPSVLGEILRLGPLPASVRTVNLAGEALPQSLVDLLYEQGTVETVFNLYGPTEDTTYSTWMRVEAGAERGPAIGRPIANTRAYVLDGARQPVAIGTAGELHLAGLGLARGYLNHPELTAEKFIADPFAADSGGRLYRTGDLARYRKDGQIEYLGRLDQQVKVRGFRIELGEIEAALGRHPEVREAVVLAREDVVGEKRLVAYVVPVGTTAPTIGELRGFLKERLPNFMEPSVFVMLDQLPLTSNGKVDRRALPEPETSRSGLEQTYEAPRTPVEQVLAEIWAELLRVSQVGVHDNFFELGGDSILGIQIVSKARKAGLLLTPRQIFQHQTIAELAAVAGAASLPAEQGFVQGPVPLTPIQRWFFEQALPDPHQWNMPRLLELRRSLNPALLERAISCLLEHHDALRLRFVRGESGWEQVNAGPEGARVFTRVDLLGLSELDRQTALHKAAEELQGSLNLSEGPLLRAAFFDRGLSEPGHLLLVVHHLAVDGVSWRILLEDLQAAYEQLERGDRVALPPKTTSFQQWSHRLTEHARSGALEMELPYWLGEPRHPVQRLPLDFPEGIKTNTEGTARMVSVSLSAEETRALLQEVPAAFHTQINDALLTALAQAFCHWTGADSLLIDLEGHGREEILEHVDLSRTVGWFTTLFPVQLELDEADAPGEALKSIKEQLRRVPNRGIGFGCLRYLSQNEDTVRRLSALPQAEVSFNYFGQLDQPSKESSLFRATQRSVGRARSPRQHRGHLLDINGKVTGGRLQMNWSYSESVYRPGTVEALADNFLRKLQALISNCRSHGAGGYTPSDFPDVALSQEQLEKVLAELSFPPTPEN